MLRKGYEQLSTLLKAIAGWKYFKPAVNMACAVPLVLVVLKVLASENLPWFVASLKPLVDSTIGGLGVDVTKSLLHETGEDSLLLLLACLAITPIRRIFQVNAIQRVRKLIGLWSFAYALVHVTLYVGLDQACFDWASCDGGLIVEDIFSRPFIFVGMLAFVCLTLLAVTSPTAAVRLLKKNWQRLHRLIYVAGIAAVIHFIWIQKADYGEPLVWAGWLALLLMIRVYFAIQKRRRA